MNKKIKSRLIPVAIAAIVLILIIVLIVSGTKQEKKDSQSGEASVSVDRINLKDDGSTAAQLSSLKTEVEIQFEDCAVAVGTMLKMVALVVPENTEQALVWNASDASVAEIDSEGILTVTGTGTAVITATVGTVTDSVVIEGIESVASGSKNNLPVYTGTVIANRESASGSTGSTQTGNTGSTGNTGNTVSQTGGQTSSNVSGNSSDTGSAGNESLGGSSQEGGSGSTSSENGQTTGGSSDTQTGYTPENSGQTSNTSTGTTVSTDLISGYGFTQRYSNVYVYEADQTYYGEIITQPNVTIIYIKQRNAEFDSKIQSVIGEILPDDDGQVWNNYLSAGTDRTFMVDDHKVRIVVAPNGGHSQIVIYN
jgi:hypothetical protein